MKYRNPGRALLLALVLCCGPAAVRGDVTFRDDWSAAGEVEVAGEGWRALFRRDSVGPEFASGDQSVRVCPFNGDGAESDGLVSCEILGTGTEQAPEIHAVFSAAGENIDVRFGFTDSGTMRVIPGDGTQGVCVRGPITVGVLPGIRLEDVLYRPEDHPGRREIHVPAENWFAGLLQGGNGIVACAWPDGGQTLDLVLVDDASQPAIEAMKIALDGKDLYLELLAAPAIWRREKLPRDYLEKDVPIDWQPPFSATYKTQLPIRAESTAQRTFVFRKKRNVQYRPEVGDAVWPVWFEGGQAMVHLSKKIPPGGEAVIYPFDDGDRTLMGFLRRTPVADAVVKRNDKAELPYGPRNAANVGFVACGGTQLLRQTVFALGLQQREKEFLTEYVDFLADYVAIVQQKCAAYFAFLKATREKLQCAIEDPACGDDVRAYLERMLEHADEIEEGLRWKMERFGDDTPEAHIAHADRAAERLKELLDVGGTESFPECDRLVETFNVLSWAHDEATGMRFSMSAREWAEDAALACAGNPEALPLAQEIRAAIRDALNGAPQW